MIAWPRLARSMLAAGGVLAAAGCDNMQHQSHLRPYEASDHFADGASARTPPAHTVPHGRTAAAVPPRATRAVLQRGRERFAIHCAVCHGLDGYGRGIVVRRGFPAAPSLHDARLRTASAAHFYDVIVRGYGLMYPAGYRIDPADRWAIVAYIRALQRSQRASLADVPPEERARLTAP